MLNRSWQAGERRGLYSAVDKDVLTAFADRDAFSAELSSLGHQPTDQSDLSKNILRRARSKEAAIQTLLQIILLPAQPCARPPLHHVQKIEYC